MTALTWETATDWDNAVSENGVVHESVTNTDHNDATIVKQGYEIASPYLSTSLLAYYPLHEDSGSTANDFSGNNLDGSVSGATLNATGLLGTSAYSFDGVDDLVDLGSPSQFDISGGQTVCAWFNTNGSSSNNQIVCNRPDSGATWTIEILVKDTGEVQTDVHDGSDAYSVSSPQTQDDGQWHHVARTIEPNGTLRLYIDGSEVANTSASAFDSTSTNQTTFIGARNGGKQFFPGRIADVRVYGKILSSSEVQALSNVVAAPGSLITAGRTS